jgi:hypothetical protein
MIAVDLYIVEQAFDDCLPRLLDRGKRVRSTRSAGEATFRSVDDEARAIEDFEKGDPYLPHRVVIQVDEVQPAVARKPEDCGRPRAELERNFATQKGPRRWSTRGDSGAVDHLIDPAVVAQPDQHDVQTTRAKDQREFVLGLPDVGSVDTQWLGIHVATIGRAGLFDQLSTPNRPPCQISIVALLARCGRQRI